MALNLSKISILCSISFLLIPVIPQPMMGCGGGDPIDITALSLFAPEIISKDQFSPFFLTFENYYGFNDYDRAATNEASNTDAWEMYFDHALTREHVDLLVHRFSRNKLDSVIAMTQGRLPGGIPGFDVFQKNGKYTAGLTYLQLAKSIEKATQVEYYNWEPVVADSMKLIRLKPAIEKGWKNERDQELKMRYGYQLVRYCFLRGNYEQGIRFYDEQFASMPKGSSIYYRTLGYKAACLYRLHRFAESNLIYAQLYDEYEPHRVDAMSSFHPQEETDWQQTLALAKTPREKAVLWHLFGIYADPLKGMKEIIAIDPKSDLLDLLLVRSVNLAEVRLLKGLPSLNDYDYYSSDYLEQTGTYADPLNSWKSIDSTKATSELVEFVEVTALNAPVHKNVWATSAAYLNWLTNRPQACDAWIAQAEKGASGIIEKQLKIIKALRKVTSIEKMSSRDEQEIMEWLKDFRTYGMQGFPLRIEATERFIRHRMAEVYFKNKNTLMAELIESHYDKYLSDSVLIQEMVDFMNSKTRTPFQQFLVETYPVKLHQLYEVQAVSRMYAYDFEGALVYFLKDSTSGEALLLGNPFNARKVDCHDCDHQLVQKVKYSKLRFTRKMIEIRNKAMHSADAQEQAVNAMLYASGLYNMTWYGNARIVSSTVVNWSYMDTFHYNTNGNEPRKRSPYYQCEEAQRWFLQAMRLSNEKEFKAKCAWMAAKCEHNIWLENDYPNEAEDDFRSGIYFNLMKVSFADTKYYQEVIRECGYFCSYLTPGDPDCVKIK